MASDREMNKRETGRQRERASESERTADTAIKTANAFNLKCCASDIGHRRSHCQILHQIQVLCQWLTLCI